ncbi:tetratricopeptide repeat protein [Sphingosinithalassobacter portus]|uniref:tetratricopeptide repeat protein n=1 Tax=Stakelama portus TaxID=2676234 RepID=UPI0011AB3B95|nr:SPOR domain-containing protein [Sphingosinithalassobacter portus]
MTPWLPFRTMAVSFALAATANALPAMAQQVPGEVVAPPSPLADELGDQIRILTNEPRNVEALIRAGKLSVRLDDPVAALAFFSRADEEAPDDPRVAAGRGAALVLLGRPGEALGLFARAEQGGLALSDYAADRGFAYDLLGAPELAQRDYRVAMSGPHDDETTRRYALSLGITGKVEAAMAQLEPLLRTSDRAAWRARAFILAMNGDVPGAERIAENMMPNNMGGALAPYFRRLQTMSAVDRAFAVHFGQLSPTPERIADAELAPPLPRTTEVAAPVQTAQVPPPAPPRTDRRTRREEERRRTAQEAAARRQAEDAAQREAAQTAQREREAAEAAQRERDAAEAAQRERAAAEAAQRERAAAETAQREREAAQAAQREREAAETAQRERDAAEAAQRARDAAAATPAPVPQPREQAASVDTVAQPPADTPPASVPIVASQRVESPALDAIVGSITIPASELGVAPMPGQTPASATAEPDPAPAQNVAPAPAATNRTTPRSDPAAAEPARHWVQVAGGSDASALPFTWRRLAEQAPDLFKGKQAWTTPLRFTNRLLTGPFDSSSAAQEFVNALAAEGIDAFAWTSEAGQQIRRLEVR